MTLAYGLCIVILCCLVPSLGVKEKSTDHRLIYQSEDIIRQQDAEEARLKNDSTSGHYGHSGNNNPEYSHENAIEYQTEPKKVPIYGEANHGKQPETVVINIEESMPELCSLPKKVGKCRGHMPRFYFNLGTQECERFIYGGCNGNDNRFRTIEECDSVCHPRTTL